MNRPGRVFTVLLLLASTSTLGLSTLFLLLLGMCGGLVQDGGGPAFIALMIMIVSLVIIVALIRAEMADRGSGPGGPHPPPDGD